MNSNLAVADDTAFLGVPPDQQPLVPVQSDGKLLRERVKSPTEARRIYSLIRKADEASQMERAKVQGVIDGERPYDQAELDHQGLGEICNVNWGQAKQLVQQATAPYIDLVDSSEILITTPVNFGDVQERYDWETIIADEFTRMVKNWQEFPSRYQYLVQQRLITGVAWAFFDDDIDWRFQASPIGDFLIPRDTIASDNELEVACVTRGVPPHQLFQKIEDEELAGQLGWDVAATKKVIMAAAQNEERYSDQPWEALEREFKNNDLAFGAGARKTECRLVYMWVKELDSTISMYIFPEKPIDGESNKFIFKKRSLYENASQAYKSFCYGIGTNGYFHSIRGLGADIFSIVSALNRLRCRFFDALLFSSLTTIEPESEEAVQDLSTTVIGPWFIKPAGLKVIENNSPNYGQTVLPGLQDLTTLLQQAAGNYTTEAVFNTAKERTKFELQAQMDSLASISIASLTLFYQSWESLLKEMLRRVSREDYYPQDPGGEMVAEFRQRCLDRGVPPDALMSIDVARARAVRAIGNGSAASRFSIMQQIYGLSANYDPQGRQLALRDLTRTIGGVELADRYAPAPEAQRPPMEAKTAMLENNQLVQGEFVEVLPSEMHVIHAPIHLRKLEEYVIQIDDGQADLVQVTPAMVPVYEHLLAHLEFMQNDPSFPEVKQKAQQLGEYIGNGVKALEKMQREQQEAEAQNVPQGTNPAGEAPAGRQEANQADLLQSKLIEAEVKLRHKEEEHAQKMRQREESFRQTLALKDADAASKMLRQRRMGA